MSLLTVLLTASNAVLVSPAPVATPASPLLIAHATVIDATGTPAMPDTAVLIKDGRIAIVGPMAAVSPPAGTVVLDATGQFLIPGLWDMHVHLSAMGEKALPAFLARGVTGVRDMGSDPAEVFDWRARVESGSLAGPRVVSSGTMIDGPRQARRHRVQVASAAEAAMAVARFKAQGSDFIKVHSWLPREAFLGVAAETKRQGLVLAGHVPPSIAAGEAARAGHQSIEHLSGLPLASSSRETELRTKLLAALLGKDDMSEWDLIATAEADALDSTSDAKLKSLCADLAQSHARVCPTLSFYDRIPADYPWAARIYRGAPRLIAALRRAGVEILAGTDLASMPMAFDVHTEMATLVEAGLTPMEALQAATRNAASVLGRLDSLGTVEAGKRADLVLVTADPLTDIRNTRKVDRVIREGRVFSRAALDALSPGTP